MSLSLPYLFIAGVYTAPFGLALASWHLWRRTSHRLVLGSLWGGVSSCAVLAYILHDLQKSMALRFALLAWPTAFFAGYFCAGCVMHVASWIIHQRR